MLLSKYTNGNVDTGSVLALLWQPRAQFWFLYSLFFIFLIAAFFYSASSGVRSEVFVLLVGLGFYFVRPFFEWVWVFKSIFIYFVFFCLGVLFNRVVPWFYGRRFLLVGVFFVLFLIIQSYLNFYSIKPYSAFDADVLVCAVVSLALIVSLSMCLAGFDLKWVAYVGAGSMYVYLMHIIAGSGVRVVLGRLAGISSVSVHLVLGTLLGVALPLAAARYMKRYKTRLLFVPPVQVVSMLK